MPVGFARSLLGGSSASVRTAKTLTVSGNTQIDTAYSKIGDGSILFDGIGDSLYSSNSNDFNFGNNDFTLECWVKGSTDNYRSIISQGWQFDDSNKGFWLHIFSGVIYFRYYNGSADTEVTGGTISSNQEKHIAVVGTSSTIKLYVDGIQVDSKTRQTINSTTNNLYIGSLQTNTNGYQGWIDELRISNSARYTSNFTPSTTSFINDSNTLLLLHGEGSDGSTTITDDISVEGTGGSQPDLRTLVTITGRSVSSGQTGFSVQNSFSVTRDRLANVEGVYGGAGYYYLRLKTGTYVMTVLSRSGNFTNIPSNGSYRIGAGFYGANGGDISNDYINVDNDTQFPTNIQFNITQTNNNWGIIYKQSASGAGTTSPTITISLVKI